MRINFDRLIDYMMEKDGEMARYRRVLETYKKNHGVPYGDCGYAYRYIDKEVEEIMVCRNFFDRSMAAIDAAVEVIGLNEEQLERLYDIYRAVKKWYVKTKWKRYLPEELVERIEAYVVG